MLIIAGNQHSEPAGIWFEAAAKVTPTVGRSSVGVSRSEPQQHVAVTRQWRAPASQVAAVQLVDVVDQPVVVKMRLIFGDDIGAREPSRPGLKGLAHLLAGSRHGPR